MSTRIPKTVILVTVIFGILGVPRRAPAQCEVHEVAKVTASDADANDRFGVAVAVDGDLAVFGASEDTDGGANAGSAYVFRYDGTDWIEEAHLTASDTAAWTQFGVAVAVSGDVVAIGANWDHDEGVRAGAVYVFRYDGTTWIEEVKLKASDASTQDRFGERISLDGEVLVVSASRDDEACPQDPGCNSGSAYVFRFDGESWIEEAKLTASDAAEDDRFGWVAVDGDLIVVGAFYDDDACTSDPECDSGSAYVYRYDGANWNEEDKLTASDTEAGDLFGSSVSVSGDVVLVGARYDDDACGMDPDCNSGSAYVFRFDGDKWVQEAKLTASDAESGDSFGSVAIQDDFIVVGAFYDDDVCPSDPGCDSGSAYLFSFDGVDWVEEAKLTASDASEDDRFGLNVAVDGDTIVTGAFRDDDACSNDPNCQSGSGYIFRGLSDCNNNGELDLCETDCNKNGIADECDLDSGVGEDCNGNGALDECEVVSVFSSSSGELSPIGDGFPQSFEITDAPEAIEDVVLTFTAIAWLGSSSRRIDVDLNGQPIGSVFEFSGSFCPSEPDVDQLIVSAEVLNAAVGSGAAVINMVATSNVSPFICDDPESFIAVNVEYPYVDPSVDCQTDGVPDECQLAKNDDLPAGGDGIPDECNCITSADCDDDDLCNGIETCDTETALCNSGTPIEIEDDGIECTIDTCDPPTGEVLHLPDDSLCDDSNECAVDFCDEEVGCLSDPAAADGMVCDAGNGRCDDGLCVPCDCDDGNECTVDSCLPQDGCDHDAAATEGSPCDIDGEPGSCQDGVCEGQCQLNESAILLASDGEFYERFGVSVSISQNVAVSGAFWDDEGGTGAGAAYVYQFDGTDWIEEAKLTASDAETYDEFGIAVAISEGVVVVGARNEGNTGYPNADGHGAAYVYRSNETQWIEEAKLVASDALPGDRFGISVAISGDVAVIGNHAIFSDDMGSAHVYRFDGTDWIEEAVLTASDPAANDKYAFSVSVSGDLIVVGAWNDDDDGSDSGSAYVYRFDPGTSEWIEEAKLTASDAGIQDFFGYAVSVSGDVVAIGAYGDADGGYRSGAAYVFRFNPGEPGQWNEEGKLTRADAAEYEFFGDEVSISGDVVLIGARNAGNTGYPNTDGPGAVYAYRFDGVSWVAEARLTASQPAPGEMFGGSVSIAGSVVMVGAYRNDDAGTDSGAAYVFNDLSDCDEGDGDPPEEASTTLPFVDNFLSIDLDTSLWIGNDGASINAIGNNEPSPLSSLNIDGTEEIRSALMDTSGGGLVLAYFWQRTGGGDSPEPGDDLFVEYFNDVGEWAQIASHPGFGLDDEPYASVSIPLPPDALHTNFRIRFRTVGTLGGQPEGFDDWFVDNVCIGMPEECAAGTQCNEDCPTDVNGDNDTGPFDLTALLGCWGPASAGNCLCLDTDGDGQIGPFDLAVLLGAWGSCL